MKEQITNMSPCISVIMSVYHEPMEWLNEAVESILKQSFTDFEFIIIVDDPNNQDAIHYLQQMALNDQRIVILKNEENLGLTKSLNRGLKVAKGKYIARMDADDVSHLDRFEKQYTFMEANPHVTLLGTGVRYIDEHGKPIKVIIYQPDNDGAKSRMLFNSGFSHPSIMVRRSVLVENGVWYDENYRQTQDYRLYETLYDLGDFANLPEVLVDYRISKTQISTKLHNNQGNNMQKIRRRMINKWLKQIGYHDVDFNRDINRMEVRSDVLKLLDNKKDCYFDTFMKTMYFTNTDKKCLLLMKSFFNGDFFRLSNRDKKSLIGIVLNKVSPILL